MKIFYLTGLMLLTLVTWTSSLHAQTTIGFSTKFLSVTESTGTVSVDLQISNPAESSAELVLKKYPFSTTDSLDLNFQTQTIQIISSSPSTINVAIPINEDLLPEQDEYFVLSLENLAGASLKGSAYLTVYIKDNDRLAPAATKDIELKYVSSFDPGASTAEIVQHDPISQRLFIISSVQDRLDIADFSNPSAIQLIKSIDMLPYGGITSVSVKDGIVAVASPAANEVENGSLIFFDTDGNYLNKVTVGVLPDMVTFSPDGSLVLTANEGQPNAAYDIDPEGSVSIIDVSRGVKKLSQRDVKTLLFTAFNARENALIASGIRKLKLTSTLSQDFEPEFITISKDGKNAWVTLQENNAVAEIDLNRKSIKSVWPLGMKNYNAFGNGFDASDNSGVVHISNYPVKAFYIPDGIANFSAHGKQFLITANEGDEKEYAGLNERTTVGAVTLDPVAFPQAVVLKENHNLGRLRITNLSGDKDKDGDYDELHVVGSRSFSIWNVDTRSLVFDSGDDFERITASDPATSSIFNADNESNNFKSRSRAKGPEPEGVTIAKIEGRTYALIALERVGGIMVYDVTDPYHPKFVDYKNSRSPQAYTGDHGPEGIIFISPDHSPDGNAYTVVANEISGTLSVFSITKKQPQFIWFAKIKDVSETAGSFTLQAKASSGLPVEFETDDDEILIADNQVSVLKPGKVTVVANQSGNDNYRAADPVAKSFCIIPSAPVVTKNVIEGQTILTTNYSAGVRWYKDGAPLPMDTIPTLIATRSGVYTAKVTIDGCSSVHSERVVVIVPSRPESPHGKVTVAPNPVSDFLKIEFKETGTKAMKIFTAQGFVKEVFLTSADSYQVDVRNYNNGPYILMVTTSSGGSVFRFLKN